MPDPNARRDKALEDIARGLGEANKTLAKIERNTRGVNVKPDPFNVPQEPQPGKDDPAYPKSDHAYFKRSVDSNVDTGPYSTGYPSTPYS